MLGEAKAMHPNPAWWNKTTIVSIGIVHRCNPSCATFRMVSRSTPVCDFVQIPRTN